MSNAIDRRLAARRELLMLRLERILEAERRGEGATTSLELELLGDELEFIGDLTRTRYLMVIKQAVSVFPQHPGEG